MAYEDKNWTFSPTTATWGTGGAEKVLYRGCGATTDAAATVEAANYFNAAASRLPDGGVAIVEAVVGIGGTIKYKNLLLTRSGAVVTAALLATTAG